MKIVDILGIVCSIADIVVECGVALDPVGHRVVLLVEFREQVLGRHVNPPPFPAPGGIVLEVRDPGFVSICVHWTLGLSMTR
jgi:hypothetical protein